MKSGIITRASVMAIIKSVKELNKIHSLYPSTNTDNRCIIFLDESAID